MKRTTLCTAAPAVSSMSILFALYSLRRFNVTLYTRSTTSDWYLIVAAASGTTNVTCDFKIPVKRVSGSARNATGIKNTVGKVCVHLALHVVGATLGIPMLDVLVGLV